MVVQPLNKVGQPPKPGLKKREAEPGKSCDDPAANDRGHCNHLFEGVTEEMGHEVSVKALSSGGGEIGGVPPVDRHGHVKLLRRFIKRIEIGMIQVLAVNAWRQRHSALSYI